MKQQSPQPPVPLRYVPGDPFANEEADVGAWSKHFTYLSVVPGEGGGGGSVEEEKCGSGSSSLLSKKCSVAESPPRDHACAPDLMDIGEGSDQDTGRGPSEVINNKRRRPQQDGGGDATVSDIAAAATSAAAAAPPALPAAAAEITDTQRGKQQGQRGKPEEEEEVFASHGVYEEYLAYDCRPPDDGESNSNGDDGGGSGGGGYHDSHADHNDGHRSRIVATDVVEGRPGPTGGSGAPVTSARATALASVAAAADDAAAAEEQDGWVDDKSARLAVATPAAAAAAGGGEHRAARPLRPDTPQRELRQEIMDRLFDELWGRITPELLPFVNSSIGTGGAEGRESERARVVGFRHTRPHEMDV